MLPINTQHSAERWFELGNTFSSKQQFERAALAYASAIECGAQDPRCYFNLGVVRTIQKRVEEAERCYGAALRLRPDYPEAHNNLAILRQFAGDIGQARRHYVESFQSREGFPEARYNYASLLQHCGSLEEACREYRAFLKQQPRHAAAHNNLGNTLLGLGRPSEALTHFKRAVEIDPHAPDVRFNRGVAHLTLGHYKEGWRDYEARLHAPEHPPVRTVAAHWKGQPLKGKTLLICAEQGLGDTLQFIRFGPAISQRGGRVTLQCPAVLVKMLSRMPELEAVLTKERATTHFDFQLALLSAPQRLDITPPTIPPAPYLTAEPGLANDWRAHVVAIAGAASPRVGLCWTGNPNHKNNHNRSMAPSLFETLGHTPRAAFFSLCPDALDWPDLHLLPLLRPLVDFEDTAALIANLDLVITVDTAVAHLAGALGRPVWILLPYAADWRWLTGREDSPWYPSAKLFRQRKPGDWVEVMDRVRQELDRRR
jgi:tetratricopeptide (TPR) repeat protein